MMNIHVLSLFPDMFEGVFGSSILKKAQELGEKMQKVQGNATPEQIARFAEIQKKFLNSATNN